MKLVEPTGAGPCEVRPEREALRRALDGFEGSSLVLCSRARLEDEVLHRLAACLGSIAGREIELETKVNPTQEAGAIVYIGEGRRFVLDPRTRWLTDIERLAEERAQMGELPDTAATYRFLSDQLKQTSPRPAVEELLDTGSVLEVGDGVALVSGLRDVGSQELVEFSGGLYGLAFNLATDHVGCILLGSEEGIREGGDVVRTGHLLRVPAGDALCGRVLNALGQPIDGHGPVAAAAHLLAERKAPGIVERQPVDTPLHTGIKVLDALVPLGRGQRELIIGDRKIGKTTLAVDTILAQRDTGVVCIYAAIGQKASSVARVVQTLADHDALDYTIVVAALPGEPPAFRYLCPYAACAMGEYFMERGQDALVVFDDLSKHAVTYREMSALLDRPIGREAYPGDIFYVHSRLLERAARLSADRGGGSLTALPVIETLAGDISAFIPTNVISICDGQIVLDSQLFNEGSRPAMDVGLSVSRVGGSAQTTVMKRVAGRLRIDLAQYREMAQFVKFGAEVDAATTAQLARGERSRELLLQGQHAPMRLEHEVLVLFAVGEGAFDSIPVDEMSEIEERFIAYVERCHADLLASIREAPDLDDALRATLGAALSGFLEEQGHPGSSDDAGGVA